MQETEPKARGGPYADQVREAYPPLLKCAEAAEILRVNPRTIERMCRDGQIRATRVRGTWRINRDALIKFANLD